MPLDRGRPELAVDAAALTPRALRALGAPGADVREELVSGTIDFLKSAAPRLTVVRRPNGRDDTLEMPTPDGAQYRLSLHPGILEIVARLLPPLEDRVFWHWAFRTQRHGSIEQAETEFFRCIGLFLAYPTRIIQRRGLVNTRFKCFAQTPDGDASIGRSVAAFLSKDVPEICDRECTYSSPPLLAASMGTDGRQDR
jgi:hypothetical protein